MEQLFLQELKEIMPLEIIPAFSPYLEEMELQKKIQITYQMLLCSARTRDRIFTLINAFYLGKLLEVETIFLAQ